MFSMREYITLEERDISLVDKQPEEQLLFILESLDNILKKIKQQSL